MKRTTHEQFINNILWPTAVMFCFEGSLLILTVFGAHFMKVKYKIS